MKRFALLISLLCMPFLSIHAQDCKAAKALLKHIYHPDRLVEQKGCISVKGTVVKKIKEKDGDFHIRLKLDAGQDDGLINGKNVEKQGGNLVFEPVCINKVDQETAKEACRKFQQKISIPNKGDHVEVTGIHVLDTEHGWLEIHPVTKIKNLPAAKTKKTKKLRRNK